MAPTSFGLRPSSGSLQLSLAKIISILKHSVKFLPNLLWGGVAACPSMACVFYAVLCTAHNTHSNKLRRNLTECFNININLARLICKLPDDGRRPKHVGTI